MTLRRNISGSALSTPFIDWEVPEGAEVETPDTQPDGSEIIWDPALWELVHPRRDASATDTAVTDQQVASVEHEGETRPAVARTTKNRE